MSQVTQPRTSLPSLARPRRTVWLAALLALAAGAAVVFILTLGGESSDNAAPVSAQAQPSLRSDGGPEETSVATAVGSRPALGPDESRIAAAVGGSSTQVSSGPDESRIAEAVGATSSQSPSGARREPHRSFHLGPLDRPGPGVKAPVGVCASVVKRSLTLTGTALKSRPEIARLAEPVRVSPAVHELLERGVGLRGGEAAPHHGVRAC